MKLSDYVIKFLEQYGIKDVFLLSGGGMMHLLDSINSSSKINKYYNLNEQASSYCADVYAQATNTLGFCMITTGPGATNAITGVASAYIDSSPILVISGQVRTNAMVADTGARQIGAQEVNIIPMVKPITKYAVTIMNANEIRYHLEKAVYLATHGRKGAVWLDMPLDIQATKIDETTLIGFDPEKEGYIEKISNADIINSVDRLYSLLSHSKRPAILAGSGVFFSDASDKFAELSHKLNIPVLCTNKFSHIASKIDNHLFFGAPGSCATRYSNYILQNCDLLIVIGCGLRYYITAFDEKHFAPYAKKVNINIDSTEITKLKMDFELFIECDARRFISTVLKDVAKYNAPDTTEWLNYCHDIKKKYPALNSIIRTNPELPDMWTVYKALKDNLRFDDIVSTVCVSKCVIPFYLDFEPNDEQKFIQPVGLGAMGQGVPTVIASCIAFNKKRTIMFEGDGSLQHNIQELALINTYNLPIKLFIDNNDGYSQIYGMQQNHFNGRLAGCNPESGIQFPCLEKIAEAYGIEYVSIKTADEIESKMQYIMKDDRAIICEFFTQIDFPFVLVTQSRVLENGQMSTSSLEDLFPFLSEEEHRQNMIAEKYI